MTSENTENPKSTTDLSLRQYSTSRIEKNRFGCGSKFILKYDKFRITIFPVLFDDRRLLLWKKVMS